MDSNQFSLEPQTEIGRRRDQLRELCEVALDPAERPWFVSDAATLWDIYVGDEAEFIDKCRRHYGVDLDPGKFRIPVWELIDYLEANRRRE